MRTLFLSLALLLTAPAAFAQQSAQDLFPNQQGNTWTYTGGMSGTQTNDVTLSARSGGWAQVDGFLGDNWWWMSSTSGRLYVWNASSGRYSLVFDLGAGQGNTFTADADDLMCMGGAGYEILDDGATVQTAVGTFNDCVIVGQTRNPCADAGLARVVFAPGVGIVEYTEQSFTGPRTWKLTRATVNGRDYTAQPAGFSGGFSTGLAIDKADYAVGETLQLRFDVKNQTAAGIVFMFNSGQTFDYVISDASGNEVYRWSWGRFFTMAIRRVELLAGEEWSFPFGIPLSDRSGAALPAGQYTLVASLKTGRRTTVTTTFEIR